MAPSDDLLPFKQADSGGLLSTLGADGEVDLGPAVTHFWPKDTKSTVSDDSKRVSNKSVHDSRDPQRLSGSYRSQGGKHLVCIENMIQRIKLSSRLYTPNGRTRSLRAADPRPYDTYKAPHRQTCHDLFVDSLEENTHSKVSNAVSGAITSSPLAPGPPRKTPSFPTSSAILFITAVALRSSSCVNLLA